MLDLLHRKAPVDEAVRGLFRLDSPLCGRINPFDGFRVAVVHRRRRMTVPRSSRPLLQQGPELRVLLAQKLELARLVDGLVAGVDGEEAVCGFAS